MSLHIFSIPFILFQTISASNSAGSRLPEDNHEHDVKNESVQFTSIPLNFMDCQFGNLPICFKDYCSPRDGIEFKIFAHIKTKTNPDQEIEEKQKGLYSIILDTDIYFFITKKNNSKPNETSLLFEFETFSIYENQLISCQKLKTTSFTFEWVRSHYITINPSTYDYTELNIDKLFSYPFMTLKFLPDSDKDLSFAPQKDDSTTKLEIEWIKHNTSKDTIDHNLFNLYCLGIAALQFKAKINKHQISFSFLKLGSKIFDHRYPLTEALKKRELQSKLSKLEKEYGHLKVEVLPSPGQPSDGQSEIIKHENTTIKDLTDELLKNIVIREEYNNLLEEKSLIEIPNKKKDDELTINKQQIQELQNDIKNKQSSYDTVTQQLNDLRKTKEKEKKVLETQLKDANKKISQLTGHKNEENTKDLGKSTKKDAMELETLRSKVKSLEKEKRIAVASVFVAVVCLVFGGAGCFFVVTSYKKKKKLNEIRARGLQGHAGNKDTI